MNSIKDCGVEFYTLTERASRRVFVYNARPNQDRLLEALHALRAGVAKYEDTVASCACTNLEEVDGTINHEQRNAGSIYAGEATIYLLWEISKTVLRDPYESEGCIDLAFVVARLFLAESDIDGA